MNEKKRLMILLGLVAALILVNAYIYLGDGAGEIGVFGGDFGGLEGADQARAQKAIEEVRRLPELSFANRKSKTLEDATAIRNPFLFGAPDRRVEEKHQQLQEELEKAREEALKAAELAQPEEPEVPPDPTFPGKVLGVMASHEDRQFQFAVALEEELFVVPLGETFANRYQLVDFRYPVVRLMFLENQKQIDINLESE